MKHALGPVFLSCLLALPAAAQQVSEKTPETIVLPTKAVAMIRQYLASQPYAQVVDGIAALDGCLGVQIPRNGVTVSHGECPEVSAALKREADMASRISALENELAKAKQPAPEQPPK